ncbi:MAG: hypothetical protein NVS3B20_02030 [Polyangiales bacterium]
MTDPPNQDYLFDGEGTPDPEVARLERALGTLRYRAPLTPRSSAIPELTTKPRDIATEKRFASLRVSRASFGLAFAATVLFGLGVASWALWLHRHPVVALVPCAGPATAVVSMQGSPSTSSATSPTWEVARLEGAPRIGDTVLGELGDKGQLGIGSWLVTDDVSRASITVADIGEVDVDQDTRVRLVQTGSTQHRLNLDHGTVHARVVAPPRLFVIESVSATAVDLGCAYSLSVDAKTGEGTLKVTSGWVSLETPEHVSLVPRGAVCHTHKGKGPGTPYFDDAPQGLRDALRHFDLDQDGARFLPQILQAARKRDSLTVFHLLSLVDKQYRGSVYRCLARLSPPPAGVGEHEAVNLDVIALDAWKTQLVSTW